MNFSSRFLLALSLSAILHGGVALLYISKSSSEQVISLGEQTKNVPIKMSMFKAIEKTTVVAQVEKILKKPKAIKKTVKKALVKKALVKKSAIPSAEVVKQSEVAEVESVQDKAEKLTEEARQGDVEQTALVASQASSEPMLNSQPVYYSQSAPRYPRKALARGQQGTVLLVLLVNAKGYVMEADVIESSGVSSLDRAAKKAVRRWRLQPAQSGGVAVVSRVKVPIKFNLQPG